MTTYNADVNLLAGKENFQRGTRSIRALESAFQHPKDICRPILRAFLQHGASLLGGPNRTLSRSLLQLAILRYEDTLDIFAEYDSKNFTYAITNMVWKETTYCDTPLTWAIRSGFEHAAIKLLSYGASPELTFRAPVDANVDFLLPGKTTIEIVKESFSQPILVAAQSEMPKVVIELLDRGADPHITLTAKQADMVFEHRSCRNSLDLVKSKIFELRGWHREDERVNYDIKGTPEELKQLSGKEHAINKLIQEYEEVESRLITLGVRTTDGVNLQQSSNSMTQQTEQKLKPDASESNETDVQPSIAKFEVLDVSKLKTLEEGCSAL